MQLFIFIVVAIVMLQVMNVFVNLFGHTGEFSVKDRKSNFRGCHLTDRSRHSSFHFILLHFTSFYFILLHVTSFHLTFIWNEGRKEGRSVVAA
jgi:hypothetical protein